MKVNWQKNKRAIVLLGPTAVGKTDFYLSLALDNFEIISADSVQVYKYLDIGSGKPGAADRERVKHYLIDLVEPDYPFNAGLFCREALNACNEISERGRVPLFVGGTGLYIDSFFMGLSDIPEIDISVRDKLYRELNEKGLNLLYEELLSIDKEFGRNLNPNDSQRIMRGLEVFRATGRPISSYYHSTEKRGHGSRNTLYIGLYEEREKLRKRIDKRVDRMLDLGFVDEVISLRERGFGPGLKSMNSIGYAEINGYIDGKMKLDEAVKKIKSVTKKYAKRQMTWFKKNKRINWFKSVELNKIEGLMNHWFKEINE